MKKCLKVVLSFSLMMSATGCNIVGGLVPNSSSSSISVPNFPIFGSSSSSSSSITTQKPTTNTSSNVINTKEFNAVVTNNGKKSTVELKEYEDGIYYTTDEILFSDDDLLNITHKYSESMNFGFIDIDASMIGYKYVKLLVSNPSAGLDSLDVKLSLESYNPYESYSIIGGFEGSNWKTDFYLYRQDENRYLSDIICMNAGDQYKIRKGSNWEQNWGEEDGSNFVIEQTGSYQFELKENNDQVEISKPILISNENVSPIGSLIDMFKQGQIDQNETFVIEGIVIARDSSNRPYIVDKYGDIILVYNRISNADLGDRIKFKGSVTSYKNLIQIGQTNFELLEHESLELNYDYLKDYVEYTFEELKYLSQETMELNNQLIKLSNLTLIKEGAYFNFSTEDGTIIQSNANLNDVPFINENNIGKKVEVYGYYFGESATKVRIVPVIVKEDSSHSHVYSKEEHKEPTCEEQGYLRHYCECGEYIEVATYPEKGHFYQNYYCIECGYCDYTDSLKFEYDVAADAYFVTGVGEIKNQSLVIPDYYNGKPVTVISSYVFRNIDTFSSVYIPDTVSTIGVKAFYGCNSLLNVYYRGSLEQWNQILIEGGNSLLSSANLVLVENAQHVHDYQPTFIWSPDFSPELVVEFVCSKDSSHILSSNEFTYSFDVLEHRYQSCTSEGYVKYRGYATYNGVTYEEEAEFVLPINAAMHNYNTQEFIKPTCEEQGYTRYICECGDSYEADYTPALGHDLTGITEFDNENHYQVTVCSRCNYREVNATEPHNFNENYVKYPTETEDGLLFAECLGCDYEFETLVPALGHTHDYQPTFIWSPDFAPELEVRFVCSKDSTHVLSPSEYSYYYETVERIDSSCVSEGYIKYHGYATYNGVTYEEEADFVLPINEYDHKYDVEFIWDYSQPTPVTARLICQNDSLHIEIINDVMWNLVEYTPPTCEIEGKIAHEAEVYYNGQNYRDYYEEIYPALGHDYVNGYCNNCNQEEYTEGLEFKHDVAWDAYFVTGYHGVNSNVVIPSKYNNLDVIIIAENAFNGCEIIESIKIPSSINTILSGAFIGTSITELEIPNSVTSIGSNIFDYNTKIKKLVVPFIGHSSDSQNMFNYFYDIEAGHAMVYPESIKTIEVTGEYEILDGNSFYYVGGVGGIENINITGCMSEVGVQTFAFSGASVLDLSNIELISYQALYYANIETLILGDKLFKVDDNAFDYANITNIYYKGSKEDFDSIFADISLFNVNVVYNYNPNHIHNFNIQQSQTPNCETPGYLRNYCECGEYEEIETYPALGHDYSSVVTDPTCKDKGYTTHTCTRCNANYVDSYIDATGHTEVVDEAVEATCTTTGLTEGKHCSTCNDVLIEQEVVPALGHTEVIDAAIEPTCTTTGLTEGKHCSVCNKVLIVQELTEIIDHNYIDYVCVVCDYNYYTEGLVFALSDDGNSYIVEKYSGTDTSVIIPSVYNGLPVTTIDWHAFKDCNSLINITIPYSVTTISEFAFIGCYSIENIVVDVKNPVFDSRNNSNAIIETATNTLRLGCKNTIIPENISCIYVAAFESCTSLTSIVIPNSVTSIEVGAFENCSSLESIIIPESVIRISDYAFSGCSSLTIVYYTGSEEQWNNLNIFNSNDEFLSANVIYNYNPNHIHNFNIQQSQTPNCETPGYLRNYCECGEYEEIETYSALNHDYQFTFNWDTVDSGLINVTIECKNDPSHAFVETVECSIQSYQEPTCAEEGIITYYAFYDYNTFIHESTFEVFVPVVGHNFDDEFVCVNCGFHYYTDGLSFAYDESNDCYSVFEYTGSDEIVIIPDEYEGKPVTRIDGYAFTNSRHITSVRFSDNIEFIGSCAFQGCDKIEYMDLPDSLVSTDYGVFWGVSSLKEITLPEGFVTLGAWTFAYCEDLESAKLPESLETIYGWAFMECHSLTSIEIPANVNLIDMYAFGHCESLTTMIVDENNKTFDSRDNCNAIIKTETNSLLHGCSNSSIPSTVTMIDSFAFYGCSTLINIEIPENITTIGACAFQYCDGLQWIVLHEGLQNIDSEAFDGCVSLQDVYYTGSSFDWENITISDSNNRHLLEAQMVYNYEHGETHEYKYRKEVSSTCCEGGIIYNYCVCGEYLADYLPPLGHVYTAENIYGDRIDGFNDFDHFDGTYNVYEKVITSNDTLVYTQLGNKPLIEFREDNDEIEPYITISEVDASVITIVLYGYYDESTGIEYISSYLDVRLNDSSVVGDLVSENKVSDTVTTYTYEYYVHSDEVGTLAIYNHFDCNFLIESISFTK